MTRVEFYDYYAKYIDDGTEFLFDTVRDKDLVGRISGDALKSFACLGCRDFGRVDMILTDECEPYVLEVNTLPGFTNHSLLPMSAKRAGIPMEKLCVKIMEAALKNYRQGV